MVLERVVEGDGGRYECRASNPCGVSVPHVIELSVQGEWGGIRGVEGLVGGLGRVVWGWFRG